MQKKMLDRKEKDLKWENPGVRVRVRVRVSVKVKLGSGSWLGLELRSG